jgi:hypothetical protein
MACCGAGLTGEAGESEIAPNQVLSHAVLGMAEKKIQTEMNFPSHSCLIKSE